jgi:Cu(I)/Ag(I) efflux system membrane fusion protein
MFQIKTVHFVEDSSPNKDNRHQHMQMEMQHNEQAEEVSAWTEATVVEVEHDRRRVTLTHGYLDAFNMMGMTMGFTVANDINVDDFVVGDTVHVEIIREDNGMFQVKTLHIMGASMKHGMEHHEANRESMEGHE